MQDKGAFAHLAQQGALITVRVTPKAARNAVLEGGDQADLRIQVTTVPEGGKATEDVRKLLARALGVAKSRLTLVRGETARDKQFRID